MNVTSDALKQLGKDLTERRENAGMTLEAVYDRTKIRPEYLRGIEAGDYRDFPEVVYIKGFVRTYLKLIGAEDMQEEFMKQLDALEKPGPNQKKQAQHKPKSLEKGCS